MAEGKEDEVNGSDLGIEIQILDLGEDLEPHRRSESKVSQIEGVNSVVVYNLAVSSGGRGKIKFRASDQSIGREEGVAKTTPGADDEISFLAGKTAFLACICIMILLMVLTVVFVLVR